MIAHLLLALCSVEIGLSCHLPTENIDKLMKIQISNIEVCFSLMQNQIQYGSSTKFNISR